MRVADIIHTPELKKEELLYLLTCTGEEEKALFHRSQEIRNQRLGNGVYMRGLIEISNVCTKDCLYCGIRKSNTNAHRYSLSDEEIIEAARYAWEHQYGSIVLQGGERSDHTFILRIEKLLRAIKELSHHELGITLSLGEQSEETYKRWFDAGAHRYLLRIETSNPELYKKIHPQDSLHDYYTRLQCIRTLQKCGYQTGTGVMIGLPFQTLEDLVDDLLFLKKLNIDMVGMGPYLEHQDTPLWQYRTNLLPQSERLKLGLHMISCLRLLMPEINIAATTALQAIEPHGREKALEIGANVIMPNITPLHNRADYRLYENKPGMDEGAEESTRQLIASVHNSGCEIQLDQWGDSLHWKKKQSSPHR
jgi:biotin synthase